MSRPEEELFARLVWRFYKKSGRHDLPWRQTKDPYAILVSELMLQQTQVPRALPKYEAFIATYPTIEALAQAPLGHVLRLWQGLGYNRRAKYLCQAARAVTASPAGFPSDLRGLLALPGVGPYTAAALLAFAYNQPVSLIETNVRTVYLHHFFPNQDGVPDSEILPIITRTLPKRRARLWYYALMDYGVHLKQTVGNQNKRSKHYAKQSTFAGSKRQLRGAILREVSKEAVTVAVLTKRLSLFTKEQVGEQIEALVSEGLLARKRQQLRLPT